MSTIETTHWGEVAFKIQPDGTREIHLVLDGREYTTEFVLSAGVAYRLGRALMESAYASGLPEGLGLMATISVCEEPHCPRHAIWWSDLARWLCEFHAWHLYGERRRWRGSRGPARA